MPQPSYKKTGPRSAIYSLQTEKRESPVASYQPEVVSLVDSCGHEFRQSDPPQSVESLSRIQIAATALHDDRLRGDRSNVEQRTRQDGVAFDLNRIAESTQAREADRPIFTDGVNAGQQVRMGLGPDVCQLGVRFRGFHFQF